MKPTYEELERRLGEAVKALGRVLGSLETTLELAYTKGGAKLTGSSETDKRMNEARAVLAGYPLPADLVRDAAPDLLTSLCEVIAHVADDSPEMWKRAEAAVAKAGGSA